MDSAITVEAKTQRSGLTLAAILDTALTMAAADGLESLNQSAKWPSAWA